METPEMSEPLDLRALFGDRHRITHDESAEGRHDPWMAQIPCAGKGVTIHPHGGDVLAVEVNGRPGVAKALAELGLAVHQDGGRGSDMTFLFPVERFEEVALIVKPRRRRKLTPEQRQACSERLAGYQFQAARHGDLEPLPAVETPPG
jgi:hypothetical protein